MGTLLVDAATLLGTAIGIFGLFQGDMPTANVDYNTVRPYIADFGGNHNAGHPGTIKNNAAGYLDFAGHTPKGGQLAGSSHPKEFKIGGVNKQVSLTGQGSQMLATELTVSAGIFDPDKATCVVGISMSGADGANNFGWSADSWAGCTKQGFQWHYGGKVLFGKLKDKKGHYNKPYYPSCMWLGTASVGCKHYVVEIGMQNYAIYQNATHHDYCTHHKFLLTDPKPSRLRNRDTSIPPGARPYKDNLIVSNIMEHSAVKLCKSPTSLGPDFINLHENLYCDMGDKTLWPLCKNGNDGHCFEIEHNATRLRSSDELIKPSRQFKEIVYHLID